MNKGLADGGPTGILDKLLDRPIDEVIRGISLLKEMFTGNSPSVPPQGTYSQEQLQQLYQQAMRYGGAPAAPQAGMPPGAVPQGGTQQGAPAYGGIQHGIVPPGAMPPQGTPNAAQSPGVAQGTQNTGRPVVPLQTGTQLPDAGTQTRPTQFANVQSM